MGRAADETLKILRRNGEAYQSDIVRATGFSKATVSEALEGLERRRLVRRSTVGRSSKVTLVGAGRPPRGRLRLGFIRSAEYQFLVPFRDALREEGTTLELRVYDNGLAVARDLSLLRIDLGIAPVLTLFMSHSLDSPFKIIGPAGSGGASLLSSPKGRRGGRAGASAVCTRMSTMELLVRSAVNSDLIPQVGSLSYASSPSEISSRLISGSADLCSIWEPYATLLEERGARRLLRYSEISDHVCCAVAAGNHLGGARVSRLARSLAASMEAFERDRDSYGAAYSALVGLDSSAVRRVSSEYAYPSELSTASVVRQLEAAGLSLPTPSSFEEALFRE